MAKYRDDDETRRAAGEAINANLLQVNNDLHTRTYGPRLVCAALLTTTTSREKEKERESRCGWEFIYRHRNIRLPMEELLLQFEWNCQLDVVGGSELERSIASSSFARMDRILNGC